MANVSDQSSDNKINIVTNVENNVTITQRNTDVVTVNASGPRGPAGAQGPQGPAGDGDLTGLNAFTGSAQASIDALNIFTGSGTFTTISASLVTATTGSFTHLKGNSPITIQDSVTFQQPVTGSIFSGSFVGNGSGLINVSTTLPSGVLSSSAQIATEISGAFASPFTSVPVIVTVLPLSPVPAVVQVIILAAVNVAVPPEVSVPPIVKSVFACSAAETETLSAAFESAVINTAEMSEPVSLLAILFSYLSIITLM